MESSNRPFKRLRVETRLTDRQKVVQKAIGPDSVTGISSEVVSIIHEFVGSTSGFEFVLQTGTGTSIVRCSLTPGDGTGDGIDAEFHEMAKSEDGIRWLTRRGADGWIGVTKKVVFEIDTNSEFTKYRLGGKEVRACGFTESEMILAYRAGPQLKSTLASFSLVPPFDSVWSIADSRDDDSWMITISGGDVVSIRTDAVQGHHSVQLYCVKTGRNFGGFYVFRLNFRVLGMAVAVLNGFVYSCGGRGDDVLPEYTSELWRFPVRPDPTGWPFHPTRPDSIRDELLGEMNRPRSGHQLVPCGSSLVAVGGESDRNGPVTIEQYDIASNRWRLIPIARPLLGRVTSATVAFLPMS